MSYFGPGVAMPTPDFLSLLQGRICALIDSSGLSRSTDMQAESSMGPFSIFAEVEPSKAGEYDDRPAIEKVLERVAGAAKRMKEVHESTLRTLGCLPDTCAAVLVVEASFTPIAQDEGHRGQWKLLVESETRVRQYCGSVMDAAKLATAFADIAGACARLQQEHGLVPPPVHPSPLELMREARGMMAGLGVVGAPRAVDDPEGG